MSDPTGILPPAHPRPPVAEKTRSRLLLVAAINGWSVAVSGALVLLISLFAWFSLWGVLLGLAATASGLMEVNGRHCVKQGRPEAVRWLAGSQLLLLGAIFLYAGYQLLWFNPHDLLKGLTPEEQEAMSSLYGGAKLEDLVAKFFHVFYAVVLVATLLYQGGLCLYYTRTMSRLALEPPPEKG